MQTKTIHIIIICMTLLAIAAIISDSFKRRIESPQTQDQYITALQYCSTLRSLPQQSDCRVNVTKYYMKQLEADK